MSRTLTLSQVVFLGLAWMTPMIFYLSYGIAVETTERNLTISYGVAFLAIFITAYSYGVMAKALPISGSAYSYAGKAIHPNAGFLIGWVLLLDYIFSPIIAILTFGIYLHAEFPFIPSWIWIVSVNIILAYVNVIGIKSTAFVSKISVILQIIFMIFFGGLVAKDILYGTHDSSFTSFLAPFSAVGSSFSAIFAGAAIICFSFLGFDTISTLSDETINPQKNIPRAIMLIIAIAGVLYLGTSFLIELGYQQFAFTDADSAALELARAVGGDLFSSLFLTILLFGIFTQGVSSVTSVSRLLFVMGREETLPSRIFGYLHPKYKTPSINIYLITVISMLALVISLDTAIKFVNFGALTAFISVNLSVISHYFIKERKRSLKQSFYYLIFPLIGTGFIGWLLSLLDIHALILGGGWSVLGILYLIYLKRSNQTTRTQSSTPTKPPIPKNTLSDNLT